MTITEQQREEIRVRELVEYPEEGLGDQFEGYSGRWHMSDLIGHTDDGRRFRYHQNLVDYWGGGSWKCITDVSAPAGFVRDVPEGAYWIRPPYATRGYMLRDGTKAEKLLPE